ncbi:TIGR01777 family oxidoreductase [Maribacter cobaltidurans]|uniref:TIGR01777 family protein n=1 Tax=Maribacter cobaltidurans TaxID=1178778 RepID=A0A223V2B2_9FLAO|nr:TIGR01777 family oxidoreductase [Maribacter cobaltidurans]ASV29138.1 TIGR01777 family protein [Maribacter cobaltidurans]GGD71597.1 NAD-dependent epimerase [Maribacter cobaltidurans]
MRILITGATGLVGTELVSHCHDKGYVVHFLTTSKDKMVSKENLKGFYWNPTKKEIDIRCFDGVTTIINLAGASISKRWTPSYKKQILNSRINSLQTLYGAIDKLPQHTITSIISASAIGIYPDSLSNYYEEDEEAVDDSFLGRVVLAWEEEADTFKSLGIMVSKVRIGLVLSDKGGALPQMAKPVKYYTGAAFGSGLQWQPWIHLSDLARIFLFVLENELEGVFNGVSPNPVTNNRLVKEIANVLNRPLILPNIPKMIMKLILGEMSYLLFASQRVSSKKIEGEGFIFEFQNICCALEVIYQNKKSNSKISNDLSKEYVS